MFRTSPVVIGQKQESLSPALQDFGLGRSKRIKIIAIDRNILVYMLALVHETRRKDNTASLSFLFFHATKYSKSKGKVAPALN
jgi:hypothetical protein